MSSLLAQQDPEIFASIEAETTRQEYELELIASENYASKAVMEAAGSVLMNKYSEGYPGKRYYAGQTNIDVVENLAIARAKEIFGTEYVNVQPLSGSPANLAVYLGLLQPGDTVLGMSLDQGGHLSHGHPLNFSGLLYNIVSYGVDKTTETIDMDEVERIAIESKPRMIIAGFSAYSRDLDWKRFRDIADKVGAYLMADISHIAGLVAGKVLTNPVPYCDIVTTTTHKTLRGPRGAIIMSKENLGPALARAVFPGVQGGPHENLVAAKAVAFREALLPSFEVYAKQVVKNAQTLAANLAAQGLRVVSGGTDNHLMLLDVFGSFGITGKEAEKALETVGISTNKNMIPFDPRKPLDPSGIRIGTPAITTRGMGAAEMEILGNIIVRTLKNREDANELEKIKQEVKNLCVKFPLYTK
ncbi:serine hydroxymethyltransferase [Candidatus Gracilibacteria bacterium]|nr:serine hydroxymethyltransferase [Candidatus Gracilibacteria bacterium]OIO77364.1 MAG: serine hydroxymethyltransferase [Candidatus Gracilibacteria bacterium CG1_02_38_174]PIQ12075.1 MAG: serine hydroxymethyltransferase [Candidatus Gracilibacteria bacterium CG18_big_fil_WC_8_21_14_2_50_38_16]PIQ42258.1 MAG: serine hydroxymethyltransferase [Candidatus Gracilibacteria bacterium CG12_big_fil_rev_8_21_14_0_65_38_15]PIZ01367.1 MAG: serine hydroxymethyltransferase [Candidatus Gracilibacteria bacteri